MKIGRVLVVGAGPAGLSAAIALLHRGLGSVDIVEVGDAEGTVGSELLLSGPMLRALDALGVADRCAEAGIGIERAVHRTVDGSQIAEQPLPPAHRPGLPPAVGIGRPVLHEILTARAGALGAEVRYNTTVVTLENAGNGVDVTFTDGSSATYDLLIGADGVGSAIRDTVLPDSERPFYVGQAVWRARVPRDGIAAELTAQYGSRAKPGVIPISADDAYLFCLVTVPEFKRIPREQFPELLRAELAEFGGPVEQVRNHITSPDHIHYSPLTPVLITDPWYRDRCVLLGDAVHATTPHLGYGAGLAVEDGLLLGEELASHESLEAGLQSFCARRYDRCKMVVDNGIQLSRWEQTPENPEADHVGLMAQSFMALGAPA